MADTLATIATIFDFDDTLLPDSTSKLLRNQGIDLGHFWTRDARALVQSGYDPALAYLKLLLDNIGEGKPLGRLTSAGLMEFGKSLDNDYFPGIPQLFDDLRREVSKYKHIEIEFYIISGGLRQIILGSQVVRDHFTAVHGSELCGDTEDGVLCHVKRCVTFTEKTRYLFEIHKGLDAQETRANPYLVNKHIPPDKRRIPFRNMIYVGDGLTDIPCFSLLKKEKGMAFGVFDPTQQKSAKQALQEFLKPARVISIHAPRYRDTDELGALIRAAVATRCSDIGLERAQAERSDY